MIHGGALPCAKCHRSQPVGPFKSPPSPLYTARTKMEYRRSDSLYVIRRAATQNVRDRGSNFRSRGFAHSRERRRDICIIHHFVVRSSCEVRRTGAMVVAIRAAFVKASHSRDLRIRARREFPFAIPIDLSLSLSFLPPAARETSRVRARRDASALVVNALARNNCATRNNRSSRTPEARNYKVSCVMTVIDDLT